MTRAKQAPQPPKTIEPVQTPEAALVRSAMNAMTSQDDASVAALKAQIEKTDPAVVDAVIGEGKADIEDYLNTARTAWDLGKGLYALAKKLGIIKK